MLTVSGNTRHVVREKHTIFSAFLLSLFPVEQALHVWVHSVQIPMRGTPPPPQGWGTLVAGLLSLSALFHLCFRCRRKRPGS